MLPTIWTKLRGIMGALFQLDGPTGPNLKNESGAIGVRDSADAAYTTARAGHIQAGATANDLASQFSLQSRIPNVVFSFDGAAPPVAGLNTGKYGVAHTTGGSYTAGQVVYDTGTSLLVVPTEVVQSITVATEVSGDIFLNAGGLYALEAGSWVLKGNHIVGIDHRGVLAAPPAAPTEADKYNIYALEGQSGYFLQSQVETRNLASVASGSGLAVSERTGYVDSTEVALSFDDVTRTFTVEPVGASFTYYIADQEYVVSAPDSIAIPDAQGEHIFFYDGATLSTIANPTAADFSETILGDKAFTAIVYWDAVAKEHIYLGMECHGARMSGRTHWYLHYVNGTVWLDGCALSNLDVDQDGSSDLHAQFGVLAGTVADEDIKLLRNAVTAGTGLPILYKSGVTGTWKRAFNAGFSVLTTGTGRLAWNEDVAGTWQLSEVPNNDFVLCHVWATNDVEYSYAAVVGQNTYSTIVSARQGALDELSALVTAGLPFVEFKPIATLVFQTSNGYANAVKGRVRSADTGEPYIDWRFSDISPASTPASHNNLLDLQGGTGGQYYHLTQAQWEQVGACSAGYIDGQVTSWVSATTVRIGTGTSCSDDALANLTLSAPVDANITVSGAGGLDTGAEVADTSYHIWLIYNPTTTTYAALLSLSATAPTMPAGYTVKRRVGSCYNNAASDIAKFRVEGRGSDRFVIYDARYRVLNSGSDTDWTIVDFSKVCPVTSRLVWLNTISNAGSAETNAFFREYGSASGDYIQAKGYILASMQSFMPLDASQRLEYKVVNFFDVVDLYAWGYRETV